MLSNLLTRWQWYLVGIVLIASALFAGAWWERRQGAREEKVKVLTHEVKVLDSIFVHDTVTAYRTQIRYDHTRITDTLAFHDTVWVPRAVADNAINACTEALHDCGRLRIVNDSLRKLSGKKPGFFSRCGVGPGGSVIVTRDGIVRAGVGISAVCLVLYP